MARMPVSRVVTGLSSGERPNQPWSHISWPYAVDRKPLRDATFSRLWLETSIRISQSPAIEYTNLLSRDQHSQPKPVPDASSCQVWVANVKSMILLNPEDNAARYFPSGDQRGLPSPSDFGSLVDFMVCVSRILSSS